MDNELLPASGPLVHAATDRMPKPSGGPEQPVAANPQSAIRHSALRNPQFDMSHASPLATAPDFSLPNQKGEITTLASLLATGPLLLAFHRGTW